MKQSTVFFSAAHMNFPYANAARQRGRLAVARSVAAMRSVSTRGVEQGLLKLKAGATAVDDSSSLLQRLRGLVKAYINNKARREAQGRIDHAVNRLLLLVAHHHKNVPDQGGQPRRLHVAFGDWMPSGTGLKGSPFPVRLFRDALLRIADTVGMGGERESEREKSSLDDLSM